MQKGRWRESTEYILHIIFQHLDQASTWPSTFLPFIFTDGAGHWSNLNATPSPPQPFSLSLYRAPAQSPCSADFQEQCLSDHHCSPNPLFISVCWFVFTVFLHASRKRCVWLVMVSYIREICLIEMDIWEDIWRSCRFLEVKVCIENIGCFANKRK